MDTFYRTAKLLDRQPETPLSKCKGHSFTPFSPPFIYSLFNVRFLKPDESRGSPLIFFGSVRPFFLFFVSKKSSWSFMKFCSKLDFQKSLKVPFYNIEPLRVLSLGYSADFRRSRLVKDLRQGNLQPKKCLKCSLELLHCPLQYKKTYKSRAVEKNRYRVEHWLWIHHKLIYVNNPNHKTISPLIVISPNVIGFLGPQFWTQTKTN